MTIREQYSVYTLNTLLGNKENLVLEEAKFKTNRDNRFDSEKEAIEALAEDEMMWQNYVILKQVYINDF